MSGTTVIPLKYTIPHANISQAFKAYTRRLKSKKAILVNSETNTRTYRFAYEKIPPWLKKIIKVEHLVLQEEINIDKKKRMFTVVSEHQIPILKSTFVSSINFVENESESTVVFGNVRIKNIPTSLKALANNKLKKWIEQDFLHDRKQEATIIYET